MSISMLEFEGAYGTLRAIVSNPSKECTKGVLMLHGFERASSTEPKFKGLADRLYAKNISSMRLDYGGCGLSDGNFEELSVATMVKDVQSALAIYKSHGISDIAVIGHSLSGCVIAKTIDEFTKAVLLAPALNQQGLLRYFFVRAQMKKEGIAIDWNNYTEYLNEKSFMDFVAQPRHMTKAHMIGRKYYEENQGLHYAHLLEQSLDKVLIIHGDKDDKVPLESIGLENAPICLVAGGDHDLERPDMYKQWIQKAINFLSE